MRGNGEVLTLCYILDEAGENKGHVVAWFEAVPERTGDEGGHAGAETGLLALRRDAQVDVVSQPVVGVHVPVAQICMAVLRKLHARRPNVGQAAPVWFAGFGIQAFVPDAREDAGAFGHHPDAVVLHSGDEVEHVEVEDPPQDVVLGELIS